MKNKTLYMLIPVIAFSVYACDQQKSETGAADLEVAAKMIGETLSDEQDGLMSSLFDATATNSNGQLSLGNGFRKELSGEETQLAPGEMQPRHGRGGERNVQISYDSLTGVHTVTFQRSVSNADFSKSSSFTYKYIYKDADGGFVQFPRRDGFASVDFDGVKTGSVSGPRGSSNFDRKGKFLLSGLESASTALDYSGEFSGTGFHSFTDSAGAEVSREMTFKYVLTNISIEKSALVLEEALSEGVTGTITYQVNVKKTVNGETTEEVMEGTIDLAGDGTALLEYLGHSRKFILNLATGEARRRR